MSLIHLLGYETTNHFNLMQSMLIVYSSCYFSSLEGNLRKVSDISTSGIYFELFSILYQPLCQLGRRQRSGIDTIRYHYWPRAHHGKVTKTQENITNKIAKRLTLSQEVTTRLQRIDKTARQTRNINYKMDSQKKHRLGTVNKNNGGLKLVSWY